MGSISSLIMIQFPQVGIHSYLSLCVVVIATGGIYSCLLIIIELRVPPMQIGAIMLAINTFSTTTCFLVPYITLLPAPYPLAVICVMITSAFLLAFFLPNPGKHLPHSTQIANNVTYLEEKSIDVPLNALVALNQTGPDLVSRWNVHANSFEATYFERKHGVRRPRLTNMNQDPQLFDISKRFADSRGGADMNANEAHRRSDAFLLETWNVAT